MNSAFICDEHTPTIIVGSTNQVKVNAVKEVIPHYPFLAQASIFSVNAASGVKPQPLSLAETIQGAINRARNAFEACTLSIGIESGLLRVPYTETGFMNICACVIYNGNSYCLGLSSAFECPAPVTDLMVNHGLDMNQAFLQVGITDNPTLGAGEGAVGMLTHGRINRVEYTKQAVMMALIKVECASLFL